MGVYEDVTSVEYDSSGNRIPAVKWVEGVSIIVAVLLVVLVGSINDYQKEKQFQRLNAKKQDRKLNASVYYKVACPKKLTLSYRIRPFVHRRTCKSL